MPSGADIEYARLLRRANNPSAAGLDGARLNQLEDLEFLVRSDDVENIVVSDDPQLPTPPGPTIWIPDTNWLINHEHPENAPAFATTFRSGNYVNLFSNAEAASENLNAFAGALYQRLNMAPFYWPEEASNIQSVHANISTVGTGVVRFGLFSQPSINGLVGPLETDIGTIDSTVLGSATINKTFSIVKGWHWLTWAWQGLATTGPVLTGRTPRNPLFNASMSSLSLTNITNTMYPSMGVVTGAFPSSVGNIYNANGSTVPAIAFRLAA